MRFHYCPHPMTVFQNNVHFLPHVLSNGCCPIHLTLPDVGVMTIVYLQDKFN